MLRKFSIFLICLSPIGSFASDFDEVLSTVVGNNLTQKSILASERHAALCFAGTISYNFDMR